MILNIKKTIKRDNYKYTDYFIKLNSNIINKTYIKKKFIFKNIKLGYKQVAWESDLCGRFTKGHVTQLERKPLR